MSSGDVTSKGEEPLRRFGDVFVGFSKKRLRAEVSATQRYVDWLSTRKPESDREFSWDRAANKILADAEKCQSVQQGWQLLAIANRIALEGLDPLERLAQAVAVVEEGKSKLRSWRKRTVLGNLESYVKASLSPATTTLRVSQKVLDDHHQNVYLKKEVRKRQAIVGYLSLVVGLVLLYPLVVRGSFAADSDILRDTGAFQGVAVLGWISGSMSVIISTLRARDKSRIPDLLDQWLTTVLRPALGMGSAVLAVLLLQTGVLDSVVQGRPIVAFSIFAGFSEQFLVGLISKARRSEADDQS